MARRLACNPPEVAAAVRTLWLDTEASRVVRAFNDAGVPSVLLKGPATAHWFYGDAPRTYGDIDLLVPPDSFGEATAVLDGLGFADPLVGARQEERCDHADTWVGPAGVNVDLHRTLALVETAPDHVWEVVHAQITRLPDHPEVLIPNLPCSLLVVAHHAAQHGVRRNQSLDDLARALVVAEPEDWAVADELARDIGARAPFALGLRLLPAGRRLADSLGIHAPCSRSLRIRATSATRTAASWDAFFSLNGTRHRIAFLWRRAFPSRPSLALQHRIAARGRAGMAFARAWHPVHLVVRVVRHAPRAFVALRKARVADKESMPV